VVQQLEHSLHVPAGSVDLSLRLAVALHDVGKLSRQWQGWAHAWQQLLAAHDPNRYTLGVGRHFLAKTDMLNDYEQERILKRALPALAPPAHACAGVIVSIKLIQQRILEAFQADFQTVALSDDQREGGKALLRATLSAIARHHTPSATS